MAEGCVGLALPHQIQPNWPEALPSVDSNAHIRGMDPSSTPFAERLSTLDEAFLTNETETCPMHVGAVMILDDEPLRSDEGGVDFDAIVAFIEGALPQEPRFTQRLRSVPGLPDHVWVDDGHFDIHYHVRHTALPRPGDERQLKRLAGRIFSQPLDRSRPLWEFWVVEGLEGGRFAMICKVHHCLTDGMGAVNILRAMVGAKARDAKPFVPRPEPTGRALAGEALAHRARNLGGLRERAAKLFERAGDNARSPLEGLVGTLQRALRPAPQTSLNPEGIGPNRRFDALRIPLADVKAVKNALGGKVNDVVLATFSLGLHRYFAARGEDSASYRGFRVLVPASVRSDAASSEVGNRVATLIATLPVEASDPREMYSRVLTETRYLKEESNAIQGVQLLEELDDAVGLGAVSAAFTVASRLRAFNAIVTNVPGPPIPLPLFGAPMREIYGLVPLFSQQGLGVTLFSYAGQLHWGLNADWGVVRDLHFLADSIRGAFSELVALAAAES